MRVHPASTQREQHTEPLSWAQDLAFAVPANTQNKNCLEMANNVERQGRRPPNDQELAEVVHASHDS